MDRGGVVLPLRITSSQTPSSSRIGSGRSAVLALNQRTTGGLDVVLEHPGGGDHLGDGGGRVLDAAEQQDVAAADRRAGGVLDAEHDPDAALDGGGIALGPAVRGGVVADELGERGLQRRVGGGGNLSRIPGAGPGAVEQDELPVGHRAQQRHVRPGRSSSRTRGGSCLPGARSRR